MKRKGRKSKSNENSANGLGDRQDQNGDASERDDEDSGEPEDKRRKSNKRKSAFVCKANCRQKATIIVSTLLHFITDCTPTFFVNSKNLLITLCLVGMMFVLPEDIPYPRFT
jgi:hypothetical protein